MDLQGKSFKVMLWYGPIQIGAVVLFIPIQTMLPIQKNSSFQGCCFSSRRKHTRTILGLGSHKNMRRALLNQTNRPSSPASSFIQWRTSYPGKQTNPFPWCCFLHWDSQVCCLNMWRFPLDSKLVVIDGTHLNEAPHLCYAWLLLRLNIPQICWLIFYHHIWLSPLTDPQSPFKLHEPIQTPQGVSF